MAVLLLISVAGRGEVPVTWYEGVVVLKTNEVMVGEVFIQPSLNVVLFRSSGKTSFFPAGKISYVNFNDGKVNMPRKFIAQISKLNGREMANLYEVVLQGEMSVVRKPKGSVVHGAEMDDVRSFDYFILWNNNLLKLSDFKRSIYPSMAEDSGWLKNIAQKERLDPNHASDAIRLIHFYNERVRQRVVTQ